MEEHGGESNAFTAHEHTHYYFDVQWPYLGGALDRFAQFFLCPLFTEGATERELSAVESEFAKNLQQDAWRLQQLTKSAADERHPWSRFNAGNRRSLSAEGVRSALVQFHASHYSSNLMSLAVLGRETLEALEALVAPLFAAVHNRLVPPPAWPDAFPYPNERLCRHYRVVPVKEHSFLTLTWPLPPIRGLYRSKPFRYVSHILGHEGEGSLLSLLKRRGWADELMAGENQSHSDFATFGVTITLTDLGNAHIDELVPLVFSCVAMIRSASPLPKWVFDEIGGVSRMRLRFQDTVEPSQAVLHLSETLQHVPPKHALVASFLYDEWAPDQIAAILARLTPRCMLLTHVCMLHRDVATQSEPWFGTPYTVAPISDALLAACESPPTLEELKWPEPNVFVPTDFALVCDQQTAPQPKPKRAAEPTADAVGAALAAVDVSDGGNGSSSSSAAARATLAAALASRGQIEPPALIHDTVLCEVWHKIDRTFRRPKTNLYMDVVAPVACESPTSAMLTALLFRLLSDELTEFAYPAEIAGLTCEGGAVLSSAHSLRCPTPPCVPLRARSSHDPPKSHARSSAPACRHGAPPHDRLLRGRRGSLAQAAASASTRPRAPRGPSDRRGTPRGAA